MKKTHSSFFFFPVRLAVETEHTTVTPTPLGVSHHTYSKKKKKTKEKRKKLLDKSLFFYFHESQDSQWRAKEDRPVQSLRGLCQLYRYYLKFSFIQILETCLENICKIIYTVICTENERNNQRTPITKNYKVSFISSISFNINCELNWIEKN